MDLSGARAQRRRILALLLELADSGAFIGEEAIFSAAKNLGLAVSGADQRRWHRLIRQRCEAALAQVWQ